MTVLPTTEVVVGGITPLVCWWCLVGQAGDSTPVPSDVLRLVDCTVAAHIPFHPLEEEDHDALQQ